jgi:integrase/recombinase XerD
MVKFPLRYVVKDADRHGNERYYYRRKGFPKIRLRGIPGSKEFMEAYSNALADRVGTVPRVKDSNSFEYLCNKYYNSVQYRQLSPSTQSWRRRELQHICKRNGSKPYSRLLPAHVRAFVDAKGNLPGAARNCLKALKALFRWALEYEFVTTDPTEGVKSIRYYSEGHHTWTSEEIVAFESCFPIGTTARLSLALLLYTACRRGDIVRLGPKNIQNGRLIYTQNKNAKRSPVGIDIPVHSELQRIIDATHTGPFTFLVTEYGRPFTVAGFGNRFREWCDQAGLSGCSAHGLRKAAATRLADAGATAHEIMAVTGHKTLAEVERYTAAANKRNLGDAAISKIR